LIWQDPLPEKKSKLTESDLVSLKKQISKAGLSVSQLISTAWASASTFRGSDMRGGANGARIRLAPQNGWEVNQPEELRYILSVYEKIQTAFNAKNKKNPVSMADLIVLAGNFGIEEAVKRAGYKIKVPFSGGRVDATQDQTDIESFSVLEPLADGFRNYAGPGLAKYGAELLIDKAQLLGLTAPEMTALVGGLRVLGVNHKGSEQGVLTNRVGTLTNDFFVHLLEMKTEWKPASVPGEYVGFDRKSGQERWRGSRVDLLFGSNSELRAIAEVYAQNGNELKFINDFVSAWVKVMNADRFDLKSGS